MKEIWYYLSLRIKIIYRKINDFGLHPFVGFPLIILGSFYLLNILYGRIDNPYYFCLVFIVLRFILIKHKDSELLFLNFKRIYLIKLIEIFILSIPFILISLFRNDFLSAYFYPLLTVILPLIKFDNKISVLNNIDLSFLMIDYEWIYAIRNYFILIISSFFVIILGLFVENINISIFGLILFYVIIGLSYSFAEKKELIWHHGVNGKEFIDNKIKSIIKKVILCLIFPILVFVFLYPENISTIFSIIFSILFLMINQMLSKYANFQNSLSIGISQIISILLSLLVGFYLLFLIFNLLLFYYLKVNSVGSTF